jgi:hypothetical protein
MGGLLCGGCLSTLYIPSNVVTAIPASPSQGLPIAWNPRSSAIVLWILACALSVFTARSSIYAYLLVTWALFLTLDSIVGDDRDKVGPGKFDRLLLSLPLSLCVGWYGTKVRTPDLVLLCGSVLVVILVTRGFSLNARQRTGHLLVTPVLAAGYALWLVLHLGAFARLDAAITVTALALPVLTGVGLLLLKDRPKYGGQFNPRRLWDIRTRG